MLLRRYQPKGKARQARKRQIRRRSSKAAKRILCFALWGAFTFGRGRGSGFGVRTPAQTSRLVAGASRSSPRLDIAHADPSHLGRPPPPCRQQLHDPSLARTRCREAALFHFISLCRDLAGATTPNHDCTLLLHPPWLAAVCNWQAPWPAPLARARCRDPRHGLLHDELRLCRERARIVAAKDDAATDVAATDAAASRRRCRACRCRCCRATFARLTLGRLRPPPLDTPSASID